MGLVLIVGNDIGKRIGGLGCISICGNLPKNSQKMADKSQKMGHCW